MNYRKIIAEKVRSKETVRAFAHRISLRIVTAAVRISSGNQIMFNFDKKNDTMTVTENGAEVLRLQGEESWGKALDYFKRKIHRKELDPKKTQFLFVGEKGTFDISKEFQLAA